ncbi:MAG TPA: glycosyltransferase family 1 protein [Ktedonobacteraceae bacterium]|jgi:glycosyltransferase involved in cell wall biosynthesis
MRVAIITENFLPKLDGVTRTLARLLEYLQGHGHQVLLLGPESGMEEYAGAEIVGTAGVPFPFYPELKFNFFRPLFLRRLSEFQPDVVHLADPVILGAAGLAAARMLGKPLISSYHTNLAAYCGHFGFTLLAQPMWSYNRFIHNQCALTFCPSPSTASMLSAQGFQRVRIWPRGVDIGSFRPEQRDASRRASWLGESEKVVLLYAGRVSWEKNLRLLIKAYQEMDHTNCHLVIVGDGPALREMKQELEGLPVTFTGYLQGEELASAYASADLFAFPSKTETFGQVVLEAMASGLPVVGLQAEGVCDIVEDEKTGFLLDIERVPEQEQAAAYRDLLTRLVEQHELRRDMGKAALQAATRRTWDEAMRSLLLGYEEVLEQEHPLVAA